MIGVYNYTVVLTYLSFVSALTGIYFSINGNTFIGIICLMISGLCDMFDGTVARMKKDRTVEEKKFGIELDSLSDLVAFGLLPSAIGVGLGIEKTWFSFVLFLFPLCALIRLAYFNVTETERTSKTNESRKEYLGLPVTTSAIILPVIYCLKKFLTNIFIYIYGISLFIIAILFIKKFKMIKLHGKELFILMFIGIVIFSMLLIIYI